MKDVPYVHTPCYRFVYWTDKTDEYQPANGLQIGHSVPHACDENDYTQLILSVKKSPLPIDKTDRLYNSLYTVATAQAVM